MKHRGIIGILFIVAALSAMFAWEAWGRQKIIYDEILIVKDDIERNTVLKRDMIEIKKVSYKPKNCLKPKDIHKIAGMETVQHIPKECPLFPTFFQSKGMVPGRDQYILSIPNEWLLSFPQTLRRGDTAYFYKVNQSEIGKPIFLFKTKVAFSKDSANTEVRSKDPGRFEGSGNISLIEVIVKQNQGEKLIAAADENNKLIIMYK